MLSFTFYLKYVSIELMSKSCSRCKRELDESCFWKRERGWLTSHCKDCLRKTRKKYYIKNKEKWNAYGKQYYLDHKEHLASLNRKYEVEHKEHLRDCRHKPERKEQQRLYKKKRFQEKLKEERRLRYKTDPIYKLSMTLRNRVNSAVRGNFKAGSGVRDLGMSIPEFKKYIEALFRDGMTWENYGKVWHLDHIKPLISFDLTDREQFLVAANYKNYQPLLKEENLSKGAKIL